MNTPTHYMQRALQLAGQGYGNVAPNPMVGCVIVCNDVIIGEGYHQTYGQAHAEVNAINSIINKALLPQSTVYVTLEPCSHFGKTPPCANLLVQHHVAKVVVATLDPNPLVAGKGVELLGNAGITVEVGVLQHEAQQLNKRFFVNQALQLPYIILKYAQSANGCIANANRQPVAITNATTNQLMHQYRAGEQAIMVGYNTVMTDNPSLTTRHVAGATPTRIVIDNDLTLPLDKLFFANNAPVIVLNTIKTETEQHIQYLKIEKNATLLHIFKLLYSQGISSVLVEGGAKLLQSCINQQLWHEAIVITGQLVISNGYKSPLLTRAQLMQNTHNGTDVINYYTKCN